MKWFLLGLFLIGSAYAADSYLVKIYGQHRSACTATSVAATGDNRSGPFAAGLYLIYAYTSSSDFTGVSMKCIQGNSSVTVDSTEGVKFAAGEKQIWTLVTSDYISCQTGSGSAVYDVCKQE
jgi:hypothetical protein